MCGKPHKYSCVYRDCKDCGTSLLDNLFTKLNPQKQVSWKRWELVKSKIAGKDALVTRKKENQRKYKQKKNAKKNAKMQEVLNYLVPDGVDVQDQAIMPLCDGNVDALHEIKLSTLTKGLDALLEINALSASICF